MSEYQYYEFRAVDRPLDARAMAALRAITSRAEITPTSLVNVYHFGDFKGDPDRLMDKYFDAHLYVANWGTRRLMLRVPAAALDLAAARPYWVPHTVEARATKEHVILDFHSEDEEFEDFEEGEGWLASLISLRADLLAGDLRCLYLGWLAGAQHGEVDDDEREPAVPPGLGQLSAPLRRFADFLRLDMDLVEIAAAASGEAPPSGPDREELTSWIAELPQAEKDGLLLRVLQGEGAPLVGALLRRFRQDQARRQVRAGPPAAEPARRTVGAMLEARDRRAEEKRRRAAEKAAKDQARHAREQAAARARHLDALEGREEELWRQVEAAVATRLPKEYDRAVDLLKDVRDLAERRGAAEDVATDIRRLRERHGGKRTLLQRLDRAGLPQ